MQKISEKRPYEKPDLEVCGSVSERTLFMNGSSDSRRNPPHDPHHPPHWPPWHR